MQVVFRVPADRYRIHIMKKHAIIPIFIPHKGCPNDCVFCNQKKITAHSSPVTAEDVRATADERLKTLSNPRPDTLEIAFFGGSFTGIPMEEQSAYLSVAKEYKDAGLVDKIHLSTRPDYIDEKILDNLKAFGADVIELGVQSFDPEVLKLSGRGHSADCVYESSRLIKEYGFTLGIQLMIGLPSDSMEKCIFSAEETVKIGPEIARLYPTVVIEDTELCDMYKRGEYKPLSIEEAVSRTKAMYEILDCAGINIIRVGLKSSDIIADEGSISGMTFHPAFRQLVEGAIARDRITALIDEALRMNDLDTDILPENVKIMADVYSDPGGFSNMTGNRGENRKYFEKAYPRLLFKFRADPALDDKSYRVLLKGGKIIWKRSQ